MKNYQKKCIVFILFGLSFILCINFLNSYEGYLFNIFGKIKDKNDLAFAIVFGLLALIFGLIYMFSPESEYPGYKKSIEYKKSNKNKLLKKYDCTIESKNGYNKEIYINKSLSFSKRILFLESEKYTADLLYEINKEKDLYSEASKIYRKSVLYVVLVLDNISREDLENIYSEIIRYDSKGAAKSIVIQYVIDLNENNIIKCPLNYKYFQDVLSYLEYGRQFIKYLKSIGIIK